MWRSEDACLAQSCQISGDTHTWTCVLCSVWFLFIIKFYVYVQLVPASSLSIFKSLSHHKNPRSSRSSLCKWCLSCRCLHFTRDDKITLDKRRQRPHQRDFAPVDVELSSELLVTTDDRLHLLTAAQLVLRTLHLTQAWREWHVCSHHHIHTTHWKKILMKKIYIMCVCGGGGFNQTWVLQKKSLLYV